MRSRKRMSRGKSRKVFRRYSGSKAKNTRRPTYRGGIRF